jgi:prolyl 4-hydroxylase
MASSPLPLTCLVTILVGSHVVAGAKSSSSSYVAHVPCFAAKSGGGFGMSKSKTPTTKTRKSTKPKKGGLFDEVGKSTSMTSITQTSPKLDRFGLPLPTEDDVFPPLSDDILRVPVDDDASIFRRDVVEHAMKQHLGVNLDAFDDCGYSIHSEQSETGDVSDGGNNNEPYRWKLQLLHNDPPVFQVDNFFTPAECKSYVSMVDSNNNGDRNDAKAVQITSPTFMNSVSRRTSTTWFCRYDGVPTLLSKAQRLLNVDLNQMEEPQIVRYRTGEEFSYHYDEIPSMQLSNGGQRLATLLVYLNDLDEGRGGGTIFRDLTAANKGKAKRKGSNNTNQLTVRPTTGTALLFFPSFKDGTPDVRTLHKGEVALDTKMIAQLWIHQREYKAGVPENNLQSDAKAGVGGEAARLGFV